MGEKVKKFTQNTMEYKVSMGIEKEELLQAELIMLLTSGWCVNINVLLYKSIV